MADVNNRNIDQGDALPRNHKVMLELDAKGLGLEIGPSFNPVAPKRAGYKVHILDHLDADGLRKKYPHLKPENIEEVDFVWHGEPLAELIGQTGVYDWIVASHVIEHVPDLITFLQQCAQLLKPTGGFRWWSQINATVLICIVPRARPGRSSTHITPKADGRRRAKSLTTTPMR